MAHVGLIHYEPASKAVRGVFDDIQNLRNIAEVNSFWKYLANHFPTFKKTWKSLNDLMAPGVLDSLTK